MRRTFNDLARKAHVHDLVIRAIDGHRTAEMQNRYSTVEGEETRAGVAKVIGLFGPRALVPGGRAPGSAPVGAPEAAAAATIAT